jgi:glycosyltransferase involved in cell wall biosynthesis
MPDVRPRVLAVLPALFPSTVIGVAKPLLRLHRDERISLELTLQYLVSRRAVERADAMVLCHTVDPHYGVILEWARELGRPIIYEIDDDLLAVPEHLPGLAYLREPARREQLLACIRQADVVRVYSPALQAKLASYNANVSLVAGPLDWSLMPDAPPRRTAGTVKMVYATSRAQDTIGTMLVAPLLRTLDAHPHVELTIWGPRLDRLSEHPRVRSRPLIRDYDRFFERFAREGFDIGLAPLPDDEFHRGKSNNKFREYAACGIAGIYSDTSVYDTSVEHNVTGLLVRNDDHEWHAALARLIGDAALCKAIGDRARQYAATHFTEAITDNAWLAPIIRLAAAGPRSRPAASTASGAETIIGVARFVSRLAAKAGPVRRAHGARVMWQRVWVHSLGLAQLATWEIKRRRLERRVARQRASHQRSGVVPGKTTRLTE